MKDVTRNLVVTGAKGFIGKNLVCRLNGQNTNKLKITTLHKGSNISEWETAIKSADYIIHLAGVNRAAGRSSFLKGNVDSTHNICTFVKASNKKPKILFSSSIKAVSGTDYGDTKRLAETALRELDSLGEAEVTILKLPNVFGKWSKPFYNSVVATFCHQLSQYKEIEIHDSLAELELLYIDDLVDIILKWLHSNTFCHKEALSKSIHKLTVGDLANKLIELRDFRLENLVPSAGNGLDRQLYATLLSFYSIEQQFTNYDLKSDARGTFAEIFKHPEAGQISYLTAAPGVVRGNHYHHTKVERFVVLTGKARFEFENIDDNEYFAVEAYGGDGRIIETLPGYAHNLKNIGDDLLVVMLWANEIYNDSLSDTFHSVVGIDEA